MRGDCKLAHNNSVSTGRQSHLNVKTLNPEM